MLLVPAGLKREAPEYFTRGLRNIDPSLIAYYNQLKGRWVIDRCTHGGMHGTSNHSHSAECKTTHVLWIQDPDGSYAAPDDKVLDKLRAMDLWSRHGSWQKMTGKLEEKEAEQKEKIDRDLKEDIQHASRDGRVQLNKAVTLIKRHNLTPNK
jgi:hypothetical protein